APPADPGEALTLQSDDVIGEPIAQEDPLAQALLASDDEPAAGAEPALLAEPAPLATAALIAPESFATLRIEAEDLT
ncbi:hypothetical protein, partial [Chryseobacterium sp. SIMBA_038]